MFFGLTHVTIQVILNSLTQFDTLVFLIDSTLTQLKSQIC